MARLQDAIWHGELFDIVGRRVRERRMASKLTLREVAFKMGMSYQSVSRVEEGLGAPLTFLVAFAQITGCTIGDLVPEMKKIEFNRVIQKEDA